METHATRKTPSFEDTTWSAIFDAFVILLLLLLLLVDSQSAMHKKHNAQFESDNH